MARWQPSYFQTPDEKRMAAIRANPTDRTTSASAPTSRWEAPGLDGAVRIARERGGEEQATATQFQGLRGNRWGAPGGIGPQSDIYRVQPYALDSYDGSPMQGPPMPVAEQYGPAAPTGDAWQRGLLGTPSALAAKRETAADRWTGFGKTMLDQGSSGSRGTPTAPGASARVALRREARRSPYPEDQQFGRRIGGFRDRQSNSWAP